MSVAMNNRKEFEAILADGLFFNLLPTVDNLRNFLLLPKRELLGALQMACTVEF
jgi:hypothetical protein